MATIVSTNNYKYTGKGPLDAKSLVKTYAKLLELATWTYTDPETAKESFIAYNGMMVAVWLDEDANKNGIYFLHDPAVTNITKKPTITNPENWHKMGGLGGLPGLEDQINELKTSMGSIETAVSTLQQTTNTLSTDVETLRSEVENIKSQTPVFDVLDGGNAEG